MTCHKKNYGKKWIQLLCRKLEERSKIFFYRLPKLHKISNSFLPLWPIVSSFNSFTFIWLLLKIQEYTKKKSKSYKRYKKTSLKPFIYQNYSRPLHCMRNVRIRRFSGPCFFAFALNTLLLWTPLSISFEIF